MRKPLAIYVHIPFCVRKCNYCDFLSGPASLAQKEQYITALLNEIRSYTELAKEYVVNSVFIGGGTPSSIDAWYIVDMMNELRKVFHFSDQEGKIPEITIEINPGTVTKEKLQAYYDVGINRISFGLQSTCDEELKMLGRIHTYEQFLQNYHLAREVGFQNINIDLMSALPGQTVESYKETLERILALRPEHISAYSLIIEEGTPFYEIYGEDSKVTPEILLPTEEDERLMYENTRLILHQKGYERYEISNYAKPGYECKHNCTYWKRGDYLGIGSGASSLIQNDRFHNIDDLETYIRCGVDQTKTIQDYHKELHQDYEHLSLDASMEEFMFLGLRMMKGVSIKEFKENFDKDMIDIYHDVIQKLIKEGLLIKEGDRLYLSLRGIDISNYVMSEFILET